MTRGLALLALGCALLVVSCSRGGLAHDHHRPELDSWFKGLTSKKGPCCDGSDYKHVADPDWEVKDGKYRVRFKGKWHDVPPEAVLTEPNKMGFPMVWPIEVGSKVYIRCFMPGAQG